jgi:hypothetical protein
MKDILEKYIYCYYEDSQFFWLQTVGLEDVNFELFFNFLDALIKYVIVSFVLLLIIIVLYFSLKINPAYSTHTFQYTYKPSSAYLHGMYPALLILIFVFTCLVITIEQFKLNSKYSDCFTLKMLYNRPPLCSSWLNFKQLIYMFLLHLINFASACFVNYCISIYLSIIMLNNLCLTNYLSLYISNYLTLFLYHY